MDKRKGYFPIYKDELDKDYKFYKTDTGITYLFIRSSVCKMKDNSALAKAYQKGRLISLVTPSQIITLSDMDPELVYKCIDRLIQCGRIKRTYIDEREYYEIGSVNKGQDVYFRPDDEDEEEVTEEDDELDEEVNDTDDNP